LPDESLSLGNRHFFALAALAFGILFVNLRLGDLSGYDDAFHAEQGRAILYSGDWWTIRHNGFHNPEFPPLYYWIEAISMKFWGANDFAAKFPSAVLGWGTIITVYFIAFELTGQIWVALISMVVLTTTQYFMKYATHAMTDVPFAFFIALAVLFYLRSFRQPRLFWLSGLAVALSMLTRPFVGSISLGLFFTHLLLARRYDLLRSRHVLGGAGLVLLFPSIWYGIQYRLYGIESALGPAMLLFRQLSSRKMPNLIQILGGLLKYPELLMRLYWPWLPFAAIGLLMHARRAVREKEFASIFLLAWVVWIVVPFSLGSAKQLRYIMPVFPAFAILAALPIHRWLPARRREVCFRGLYFVGLAAIVFMFFSPWNLTRAADMRQIAPIAEAHSQPHQSVILYTHGSHQWNYQNQLLWYGNRHTEFPVTLEEVLRLIEADPEAPVVMDRESFHQFESMAGPDIRLKILGESKRFFCFQTGH
jgi:4-amino-4-deoxy-L-arabinose transferase-like glycosyltransferase